MTSVEVTDAGGLVLMRDNSLSGADRQRQLSSIQARMHSLCPMPIDSLPADRAQPTASDSAPRRRIRSTSVMSGSDDSLSFHSDDSGHRSFGVVTQKDQHKRRKVDDEMVSPREGNKQAATTGTSPMLQSVPETSRLRVALEDFHMNLCTSRDAPIGCSEDSRPTDAEREGEAAKNSNHGPRMKGQKPIENFFIRAPGSGSGSSERHDHAAAGSAAGDGEEANGLGDRKGGAHVGPSKKAVGSLNMVGSTAQLRREVDLLAAEKATLQGELKHEKELRQKHQQELQDAQRSLQTLTAERDGLLQQSRVEVGRFVEEIGIRKQHQEALAKALARREGEIATMRVQINNHRLGTVVQKFSGTMAEGVIDSFEPAFAYHQLQQRINALDQQKAMIERKRVEIRPRRSSVAQEPPQGDVVQPCSNMDEILKSKIDSLEKQRKDLMADRSKLDVARMRHVREVKLQWDSNKSDYNPLVNTSLLANRYVLLNMFGKGGFAEVFRAYDIEAGSEVALKIHTVDSKVFSGAAQKEYVRRAIREVAILEGVRHQCVVRLHHVFQISDTSFAIVMEACKGGDLQTYLQERTSRQIPEREARTIISQVFEGLVYLNSNHEFRDSAGEVTLHRIIHYDLKPANILFDDLGMVKISDFGLSKLLSVDSGQQSLELTSPGAGTLYYQPPECQMVGPGGQRPMISNKVDVWAAGVIFYEMLYGRRPFHANVDQETIASSQLLLHPNALSFDAKPGVSQAAKDFIKRLLTYDHQLRPDVHEAASDVYLMSAKDRRRSVPTAALRPPEPSAGTGPQHHHEQAAAKAAAMSEGHTFLP
eukprot:jgi/Ulvmu1/4813/UM020_0098.1